MAFVAITFFLSAEGAIADGTVEIQMGPLPENAARGFLVADGAGDGFVSPGPWVLGTVLAPGETVGNSDDTIVAVFGSNGALPWPSGTGFASVLSGIDFSSMGLIPGTPLRLCWIAGSESGPAQIDSGSVIHCLEGSSFVVPPDGGTALLASLSPSLGGSLQNEDIVSGTAVDAQNLRLNTPTPLDLGPDETMFMRFTLGSGSEVLLEATDDVAAVIYDETGGWVADWEGVPVSLDAGAFFLSLSDSTGSGTGEISLALRNGEYQPDLWIGGSRRLPRKNNFYSSRPAAQSYRILFRRSTGFQLAVQNDSTLIDSIRLNATRLQRPFRQGIRSGSINVTSQIFSGRYVTADLEGNGIEVLIARITNPISSARSRRLSRASQSFFGTSSGDRSRRDSLRVLLISR